jgi:hypothetical protein
MGEDAADRLGRAKAGDRPECVGLYAGVPGSGEHFFEDREGRFVGDGGQGAGEVLLVSTGREAEAMGEQGLPRRLADLRVGVGEGSPESPVVELMPELGPRRKGVLDGDLDVGRVSAMSSRSSPHSAGSGAVPTSSRAAMRSAAPGNPGRLVAASIAFRAAAGSGSSIRSSRTARRAGAVMSIWSPAPCQSFASAVVRTSADGSDRAAIRYASPAGSPNSRRRLAAFAFPAGVAAGSSRIARMAVPASPVFSLRASRAW